MIFLTNKPIDALLNEGVRCKVSAASFNDIIGSTFPQSVVVDLAGNSNMLNAIVQQKKLQYVMAPVEFNSGNTIYIVQDALRNAIILTI